VPTARRSRLIKAPADELWAVIRDPLHLPRWWPRVTRVEDVEGDSFTEVMRTSRGKLVRADFRFVKSEEPARALSWEQQVEGTPFARVLKAAETEVWLEPVAGAAPGAPGAEARSSPPAAVAEPPRPGATDEAAGTDQGAATDQAATTEVTIELRQTLNGFLARLGGYMVRRAAAATLEEALDGLERISG
jgi:uncharacterized protein YndB with AHSA1/START domain